MRVLVVCGVIAMFTPAAVAQIKVPSLTTEVMTVDAAGHRFEPQVGPASGDVSVTTGDPCGSVARSGVSQDRFTSAMDVGVSATVPITASCPAFAEISVSGAFSASVPTEQDYRLTFYSVRGLASQRITVDGVMVEEGPVTSPVDKIEMVMVQHPLTMRIEQEATAGLPTIFAFSSAAVDVRYSTQSSALTTSGTPCGPELGAAYWYRRSTDMQNLHFVGSNVDPAAAAFFIIGTSTQNVPIPPSGCPLLTNIQAALPAVVEPDGTMVLDVAWLRASEPPVIDFYVQVMAGTVAGPVTTWETSNLVNVTL